MYSYLVLFFFFDRPPDVEKKLVVSRIFPVFTRLRLKSNHIVGHSYPVGKGPFSTQLFSTKNFDWRIQSKTSTFPTVSSSRKTQSKITPASGTHRITHPTTKYTPRRPHTHSRYHRAVSYNSPTLPHLLLLLLLAASQRGTLLAPLASSVYHTSSAVVLLKTVARFNDAILPTTATPAVAWAALG